MGIIPFLRLPVVTGYSLSPPIPLQWKTIIAPLGLGSGLSTASFCLPLYVTHKMKGNQMIIKPSKDEEIDCDGCGQELEFTPAYVRWALQHKTLNLCTDCCTLLSRGLHKTNHWLKTHIIENQNEETTKQTA